MVRLTILLLLALPAYGQVAPFVFVPSSGTPDTLDPTDIATLYVWLDAADTSETSMTRDGDSINVWKDKSGNGITFTAPTNGTGEFIISRNAQNGLPAAYRGAVADVLAEQAYEGSDSLGKPISVFAVLRKDITQNASIIGGQVQASFLWRIVSDSTSQILSSGVALIATSTGKMNTQAWYIAGVTYSAAGAYVFYKNGATDGSGTQNQDLDRKPMRLSADYDGTTENLEQGYIGELLIYESALSASAADSVMTYLNNKWAIY